MLVIAQESKVLKKPNYTHVRLLYAKYNLQGRLLIADINSYLEWFLLYRKHPKTYNMLSDAAVF